MDSDLHMTHAATGYKSFHRFQAKDGSEPCCRSRSVERSGWAQGKVPQRRGSEGLLILAVGPRHQKLKQNITAHQYGTQ